MGRVGGLVGAALGLVGYGLLAIVLVVLFLIEMPVISAGDAGSGARPAAAGPGDAAGPALRGAQRPVRRRHRAGRSRHHAAPGHRRRGALGGDLLPVRLRPVRLHALDDPSVDSHSAGARRRPGAAPLRPLLRRQLHRRQRDQAEDHGLGAGPLAAADRDRAAGLGSGARAHGRAARDSADPRREGGPPDLRQPDAAARRGSPSRAVSPSRHPRALARSVRESPA